MELILKNNRVLNISKTVFECNFNEALVHQVIVAYTARARQGTHSQKTRAEVIGSSKKPWRQKGTGRARSGSVKSPIWRSGGVTFAAKPKNYSQKVNKKMYRGALRSIFSELFRQSRLLIVEDFSIEAPKTKLLVQKLKDMMLKHVLIITNVLDKKLLLAAKNLHKVKVLSVYNINPVSLIIFDKIVITISAIEKIEAMLA